MATEKRLIDANAFLESIEGIDWYTIRVDGSATQGAPSEEVAWYKATDIYAATENAPTVDAVEVETLEAWLYQIAMNNIDNALGRACEEIIRRLDGLRMFAREGSSNATD